MSEFQRIAFRAIDGPVSEAGLQYMRQQSTRAEITPWAFDNEYHWGDFRGDAAEMLRRGYDVFVHYADFGIHRLMVRLPSGLPDPGAAAPYLGEEFVRLIADKNGPGAILAIEPDHEPGEQEDLWDFDELIDRLTGLRAEILNGDLRPLYLGHLAMALDMNHDREETTEGPVPAGLKKLTDPQLALAEFFGVNTPFLAAAAEASPPLGPSADLAKEFVDWLRAQPTATKDGWLADLMAEPQSAFRRELLGEFQKSRSRPAWPTVIAGRTVAALEARTGEIMTESARRAEEKAARDRAKRLARLAADPTEAIRETEQMVRGRGRNAYAQVAELLADLREALVGSGRSGLADEQARKLRDQNPTLRTLISELRKKGFLPKERSGVRRA